MTLPAGLFLIAHGLLHFAVWVGPPPPDAPFNPRHSWLFGSFDGPARMLAIAAGSLFVLAGGLLLAGANLAAALAVAAAALSLTLVVLTFNVWLVMAAAINVAIISIALIA